MAWPPTLPPNTRANTTPQVNTHPADHNLIADALDELVLRAAGARYSLAGAQVVATGANYAIAWTEEAEEGSLGFAISSTTRLAAPVAGFYLFAGTARWASSGGTLTRNIQWRKNAAGSATGGTRLSYATAPGFAAGATFVPFAFGAKLAAGDYVEAFASHGEAGNVTLDATDTQFSVVLR